jgi:hypothetical protein
MRKVGFVCVVLTIFATGSVPSGSPAKPGEHTPVPLIVTVNGCQTSLTSEICGDNLGGDAIYSDGEDGVKATIDKWGNLIIDFQTTRAKIRGLVYRYGATPAPPGNGSNHYLSTIGGALQPMAIGTSIDVASCPLYEDDASRLQYRHSFFRDCQSGFGSAGSPLRVTRTGTTTWEVEPTGQARVFSITTASRVEDFGEFNLPFRMTLTAK